MIHTYILKDLKFYSLNKYKSHHYVLYKTKKSYSEIIYWQLIKQKIKPVNKPITLQFIFHYKSMNYDLDNCALMKKFIIDVLCPRTKTNVYGLGVIPNDNVRHVVKICESHGHKKDGSIEMIIHEV